MKQVEIGILKIDQLFQINGNWYRRGEGIGNNRYLVYGTRTDRYGRRLVTVMKSTRKAWIY